MSSSSVAQARLAEERKSWRKNSLPGFYARPSQRTDNSTDLMVWDCGIPGRPDTDWHGGLYKLKLLFPPSYPMDPPVCRFRPVIFHPNVFSDGEASIINY